MSIVIYTKDHCPYCRMAKELLTARNQTFEEIRIDLNPERIEEMIKRSGGARSVPQIFINDVAIGGYDNLATLAKSGKLETLLNSTNNLGKDE